MLERLDHGWRIVATGFCFLSFGLSGLLLRMLVLPVMTVAVRKPGRRHQVGKLIIHHAFRLFAGLMQAVGVLRVEFRNPERLAREGLLVVANHPSLIDVIFIIAQLRRADCVVKSSLAENPFTGGPVRAAGYLFNRSGPGLVASCIDSVKSGNNLVIFPEGTRTVPGMPPKLQRGMANIAVRGDIDLTPIVIHCRPATLTKGAKWYHVPRRQVHYVIEVQKDIEIAPFLREHADEAQAARALTRFMTDYFAQETHRAAAGN